MSEKCQQIDQCNCGMQTAMQGTVPSQNTQAHINDSRTKQTHVSQQVYQNNDEQHMVCWILDSADTCGPTNSIKAPTEMKHKANINPL